MMGTRLFFVAFLALAWLPSALVAQKDRDASLFRLNGQRWAPVDGYGVRVALEPDGDPWVVNSSNEIWRMVNGTFEKQPGEAKDIGVGGDGSVWIIGTDSNIYRWNQNDWQKVPGNGVAISVDQLGAPWVVNAQHRIYHWVKNEFVLLNGEAKDIGAGNNVWIIGTDNALWQLQGSDWKSLGGAGVRVSAGAPNTAWVVNDAGEIYRWQNGAFEMVNGRAEDIAANATGQVWMVGVRGSGNRGGATRPRGRF
jgi:tectonin-like protein